MTARHSLQMTAPRSASGLVALVVLGLAAVALVALAIVLNVAQVVPRWIDVIAGAGA
jgi:hypothetical protein